MFEGFLEARENSYDKQVRDLDLGELDNNGPASKQPEERKLATNDDDELETDAQNQQPRFTFMPHDFARPTQMPGNDESGSQLGPEDVDIVGQDLSKVISEGYAEPQDEIIGSQSQAHLSGTKNPDDQEKENYKEYLNQKEDDEISPLKGSILQLLQPPGHLVEQSMLEELTPPSKAASPPNARVKYFEPIQENSMSQDNIQFDEQHEFSIKSGLRRTSGPDHQTPAQRAQCEEVGEEVCTQESDSKIKGQVWEIQ